MLDKNDVRLAIIIPIILGVILAVLYDVLQETWKWYYSQSISNNELLVNVYSKIPAGTITILFGLLMIILTYRKYFK